MPMIRKRPRNHRKETALLDMMLEMQRLSGKYPNEMSEVLICYLRTSATAEQRLRVRNALEELITTFPHSDPPAASHYVQ